MKDVARLAGVSAATASRALRNQSLVTPETRELVSKVAGQLGYAPDVAARSLSTRRSRMIGLFALLLTDYPFTDILRGVVSGAYERGYGVTLIENPDNLSRDPLQEMVKAVREGRVDGCLAYVRPEDAQRLAGLDIPCLGVESYGVQTIPTVHLDRVSAGYEMTRHLLDLGHRRIALLGMDQPSMPELIDGYRRAIRERGLEMKQELIVQYPTARMLGVDDQTREGYAKVVEAGARLAMSLAERPTAIVFHYTLRGMFALRAFRAMNIRVPDDLAVVGFADEPGSDLCDPPFTVWRGDYQAVGRKSAELLIDRIEGKEGHITQPVLVPGQLIIRESCGAAGRNSEEHIANP